ncbi:MAG: transposase, partial [Kiritimatiellales bacterium]
TGRTAPLPRGHRRAVFHGSSLDALDRLVQRHPDATLTEIKDLDCSIMAVQRALSRPGYRYKKTLHAAEQKREDVERLREQWLAELPHLDPGRLVFIDESGAKTNMTRLHGRARHGLRLLAHAPHGHGCTTTMISSIRLNGQTAAMEVEGPSDGAVFREYIRAVLAPTLCSPAISL